MHKHFCRRQITYTIVWKRAICNLLAAFYIISPLRPLVPRAFNIFKLECSMGSPAGEYVEECILKGKPEPMPNPDPASAAAKSTEEEEVQP